MADEVIQMAPDTQPQDQVDQKAALDQMMAISLNGGMQAQEATPPTEALAQEGTGQPVVTVQEPVSVTDPFGLLKEKYGYENHEAAIKEIEDLRAFKAKPQIPEFVFENEEDARILRALAAGKRNELREYLNREAQIEQLVTGDVTKENAAQIVKLKMQLTHTDLSPQEIDYRYKKQFGVPPQPVRGVDEEDDEYNSRMAQWQEVASDREMELMIEAKISRPEIAKAKGSLSIPQIETPIDEGYAQYQQMLAQKAQEDVATKEAYKALTPKSVETRINFKDEANKIDFEFQYEPDAESFGKAQEIACNADLFWQTFINPDGSPNRQLFLESILYAIDKKKIVLSAMNQAKNATIKASLPDNSQSGIVKQITQHQEPSELDQQMRMSLRGYGGY